MRLCSCLAGLLVLSQVEAWGAVAQSPAGASREQEAAAHYGQGLEHFKAGDMPQALAEFLVAYDLVPRFEALINIAVAHRKLGHYAAAYNAFQRYLSEGGDQVPPERKQQIAEELGELDRFVAHVTLAVEGGPAEIELDGKEIGESPMPTLHLDPGRHEFRARRHECGPALEALVLAAGQVVTVALKPYDPKAGLPPPFVRLNLSTVPPGADLVVDQKKVGRAPWSGELKRGEHVVSAELEGYLPHVVRLDLQGVERTVEMELERMRWYHHWYVWTVAAVLVAGGATTAAVLVARPH